MQAGINARRNQLLRNIVLAVLLVALIGVQLAQAAIAVGWGDRGDNVIAIQRKLKQWGYYTGAVDGIYGQSTYTSVVAFQRKNGLKADGVVGDSTAAALGIRLSGASQASVATSGFNDSEVRLLARVIHGEARGEPYTGKVAVGAVVLNRVRHASFPNTISGVVYQAGAFDCVADGQINLEPDSESLRAARDAMNGWDPTGGCIYYYNPVTATSDWIWSREIRLAIGKHNFAV